MKNIVMAVFLSLLSDAAFGQGKLESKFFFSEALNQGRRIEVYLPEGYNQSRRYPVLYFLQGPFSDDTLFISPSKIWLDFLIKSEAMEPIIMVFPDDRPNLTIEGFRFGSSLYTNSALYGKFENYFVQDVIEYIDTNYNTDATREKRFIGGHSMGGMTAMKLAFKHPALFRAVFSHSGPLDMNLLVFAVDTVLAENGGRPPYNYNPRGRIFTAFTYTLAGAFSPNLSNLPYKVDFPLDRDGNVNFSVFAKWLEHNPAKLARRLTKLTPDSSLAIYFDCGSKDEYLLYPFNTSFRDSLDALGILHFFYPDNGTHYDSLFAGNRVPRSFAFINSILKGVTNNIFSEKRNMIEGSALPQNSLKPFNSEITIEFSIPHAEFTVLKVYNGLGQEVDTVVSEQLPAGRHRYQWAPRNLNGGIYYYRLQTGTFVQIRKIILPR